MAYEINKLEDSIELQLWNIIEFNADVAIEKLNKNIQTHTHAVGLQSRAQQLASAQLCLCVCLCVCI